MPTDRSPATYPAEVYRAVLAERDALRAENKRLRADWQLAIKIAEGHANENERLKKEVEQVELINFRRVEENTGLQKEIEGLKALLMYHVPQLFSTEEASNAAS